MSTKLLQVVNVLFHVWLWMIEFMLRAIESVFTTQGELGQESSTTGGQTPGYVGTGFLHVLVLENGHFRRVLREVTNRHEN